MRLLDRQHEEECAIGYVSLGGIKIAGGSKQQVADAVSSLEDKIMAELRGSRWTLRFERATSPAGTTGNKTQCKPGQPSAVPAGLAPIRFGEWFLFSGVPPHEPIKTANLDKTEVQPSLRDSAWK